ERYSARRCFRRPQRTLYAAAWHDSSSLDELSHGETTIELARPVGAVLLRGHCSGASHRRCAGWQLFRRPLVEHGEPGTAHLREQQRATARAQYDSARATRFFSVGTWLRRRQLFPATSLLDRSDRRPARLVALQP